MAGPRRYRGKVVVLEFMDPHCTDIYPIVSQEFIDAYHDLGRAAGDVVFAAVNVNGMSPRRWTIKPKTGRRTYLQASLATGAGASRWSLGTSPGSRRAGWKRRSLRLLNTTNTELNAIAAAAMSGLRNPSAASGMAPAL